MGLKQESVTEVGIKLSMRVMCVELGDYFVPECDLIGLGQKRRGILVYGHIFFFLANRYYKSYIQLRMAELNIISMKVSMTSCDLSVAKLNLIGNVVCFWLLGVFILFYFIAI